MDVDKKFISFISGDEVLVGFVHRQQRNQTQVEDATGRLLPAGPKQIIGILGSLHAGAVASTLREFDTRIREAAKGIDTELLWSSMGEDRHDPSLEDIATEYFGAAGAAEQAAAVIALLTDPAHFRRTGILSFAPRTPDEMEQYRLQQQREAEKTALRERALAWLLDLQKTADEIVPVPPELEEFVAQMAAFITQGHQNDAVRILKDTAGPEHLREAGFDLLRRAGRLPPDADQFMLLHGIFPGFSKAVETHVASLAPYRPDPGRLDCSRLESFSIDDADTREVDDAITVTTEDGNVIVGIHIADPAAFVHKGDPADAAASERSLTLYLPTATVTMFPERFGCDLASLNRNEDRPALSFRVRFSPQGELLDWTFGRAQVRIVHRLTYEATDAALRPESEHPLSSALRTLLAITDRLRCEREARGAFRLNRPEIKVRLHGKEIQVKNVDAATPSRLLVGELMILANRLSAEYALRHDVPVIYRVQAPPRDTVKPVEPYDPAAFDRELSKIQRTRLSTHPEPHAGLGLDLYTQVSSPLRRYADLVIQRQLAAHLAGEPLPYNLTELLEVLSKSDSKATENKNLEREATRYWLLEYLSRQPEDRTYPATVVKGVGRHPAVELDETCVRGQFSTLAKTRLGDRVTVRIAKVRPRAGLLILQDAGAAAG
ncbi:MAG: hypothetical protein A3K18_18030 [Lentisphaerae bacterium RIFOXYA12_64_32]|nr:MAG: hypothetical protein A3K18_18030 [Lentisphaerae bacterium RIFOXYA12_64_32]